MPVEIKPAQMGAKIVFMTKMMVSDIAIETIAFAGGFTRIFKHFVHPY